MVDSKQQPSLVGLTPEADLAIRLALAVHLSRWARGEVKDETMLDTDSIREGIELAHWLYRLPDNLAMKGEPEHGTSPN